MGCGTPPSRWSKPRRRRDHPEERSDEGSHGASAERIPRCARNDTELEGAGLMAIWADNNTRVIVQGITGREGTFHAIQCRDYGTKVVGGVTPGKGGTTHEGFAVFNSVRDAREKEGANCSLIFVPPPFAADA